MSLGEGKIALNRLGKYSSRVPKLTKENKKKKMTSWKEITYIYIWKKESK